MKAQHVSFMLMCKLPWQKRYSKCLENTKIFNPREPGAPVCAMDGPEPKLLTGNYAPKDWPLGRDDASTEGNHALRLNFIF